MTGVTSGDGTEGGEEGELSRADVEGSVKGPRRPKRWNSFSALKFKIADLLSVAML